MTTGTPLDLTPFGTVLTGIGIVYWLLAIGALAFALRKPKTLKYKSLAAVAVLLVFGWKPALEGWARYKAQQKLNVAMARFDERCKTAGEKIYRTVEDVEGVLLTNVRPETKPGDKSDPNWPDAALPSEGRGDWYIRYFLFWEHHEDKRNRRGYLDGASSSQPGYKFVDVKSQDGQLQRLRLDGGKSANLVAEPVRGLPSRYAVSFQNFVDPEDRKLWIAGTRVTITDTTTKEVLAEKTWYSIEPGQGSTVGSRSPWFFAKTCPFHDGPSDGPTRFFVDQVLKPKKGE